MGAPKRRGGARVPRAYRIRDLIDHFGAKRYSEPPEFPRIVKPEKQKKESVQDKVLKMLREKGRLGVKEAATLCGLSYTTAAARLANLVILGLARRENDGRGKWSYTPVDNPTKSEEEE